jgi:transposase
MHRDLKFNIITEAQKMGVSATCEKYKISRTIYYRWLSRYKTFGIKGLEDIEKKFSPLNKTKPEIVSTIMSLIRNHPSYGPRAIKYLLEEVGYDISESAVYNVMKRNHLTTKAQRMKFSTKKDKKITRHYPCFDDLKSGECWLFWTTHYGDYESLGTIYEYTIFDYKSRVTCTRLYNTLSPECFEDLLTAAAIPVAQTLGFEIKHLCFFEEHNIKGKKLDSFLTNINGIFQNNGYEVTMHLLKEEDQLNTLQEMRKNHTHQLLSFLMPFIHKNISFSSLKIQLQKHIREYNLNYKIKYSDELCSPVEYHVKSSGTDLILPLWAYIDRTY